MGLATRWLVWTLRRTMLRMPAANDALVTGHSPVVAPLAGGGSGLWLGEFGDPRPMNHAIVVRLAIRPAATAVCLGVSKRPVRGRMRQPAR